MHYLFLPKPFPQNDPSVTLPTINPVIADHIAQSSDGCIGVGADAVPSGSGIIFGVTNRASYSPSPAIISVVANTVSSTNWPSPANTPYSFAVARVPEDPDGPDGPIDFMVDGYGNTGIGVFDPAAKMHIFNTPEPRPWGTIPHSFRIDRRKVELIGTGPAYDLIDYNDFLVSSDGLTGVGVSAPTAHLDIADQNDDGQPLLRATAHGASDAALIVGADGVVTVGASSTSASPLTGTKLKVKGQSYVEGSAYVSGTAILPHLMIPTGAINGYILKSDIVGNASWVDPSSLSSSLWASSGSDIYNINSGQVRVGAATSFTSYAKVMIHGGALLDLVNTGTDGWGNIVSFYGSTGTLRHRIYDDFGPTTGTSATMGDLVIETGVGKLWVNGGVKIGNLPAVTSSMDDKYMLYVEKGILTERLKVSLKSNSTSWSDFVFSKDYKLRSLSEVEQYYTSNHHLPDVPSASQVSADGIDVAKMDATLLQKIEELTLYVVAQQKEINALNARLNMSK